MSFYTIQLLVFLIYALAAPSFATNALGPITELAIVNRELAPDGFARS